MKKIASRFFLPVEMFLALLAIVVGVSGQMSGGTLYFALRNSSTEWIWTVGLCGIGIFQLALAVIEWCAGRAWGPLRIHQWANYRVWAAGLSGACWLLASTFLVVEAELLISLTFITPICCAFSAWSYFENYRVKDVLDETVPTSTVVLGR